MKKKFLGLTCFAVALCATVGGTVALNVSAETNAEGWELRDDGYYYEVNPPVYDLFDWEYDPEGDMPPVHWYKVNYTGQVWNNSYSPVSRESLADGTATISSSQGLYPQYDSWGKDYFFQGSENQSSDVYRHMDFTFMVDFTNLNSGYFVYFSHTTKISFQLSNNQIIVEEKEAANATDYKTWSNMQTVFLDFPTSMKELTGWQQVSVLIEDRVSASKAEITRNDNKGAKVTVTVGESSVSTVINKMGYYYGIYGIENNTGGNLALASVKMGETVKVSFDTNGGDAIADSNVEKGGKISSLPTPSKKANVFKGWYTTEDFQAGTEFTTDTVVNENITLYAKWESAPLTNAEGWKLGDDGYYYEENPPVYDLFDWEYDPEGDTPPVHWYKLNQTGSVFSNNLSTSSRELLSLDNATLTPYQGLYPQYDSWGKDYFFQGNQNQSSDVYRHMDFTFMVDFTNLNSGYFVYFSHTTKISFQLTNNQIIVEEKGAANGTDYTSWSNIQTVFLDFPTSMKELTGWQQVTVLIEDRVDASVSEITRENNKGARVTVTIGENSVSTIIDKMGYYYGIYGIENNTGGNLPLKSTFDYYEVSFESNGGSECATKYLREGKTYGEAPIPEKGAYEFMGWYSSATFEAGTEYDENAQATGDTVYYAKWIKPSDVNADGWVLGEDNFYHNPHLIYKDIFDEVANNEDAGAYNWYQINYTGKYGQKGFVANSRTAFDETNNVLPTGKMLVVQGEKGMDYVMGNATWVLINPSSFVDYDFAFEMDFTNITSGTLRYINDNIYIYFDFTNDKIIIENREAAMKYEDWSWPNPREHFEFDVALSALTGKQTVRLMIDERVKTTREEMTRDGNNGAVVTVKIGNEIAVRQVLGKLGYYVGILGFINDTNADIAFTSVKTALIKEQIQDYVKESNYTSETWTKLSAYIAQAVAEVDGKARNELDGYYVDVTKTIDAYPTAQEENAREAKKAETLASLATDYAQADYSEQTWSAMQALITAYETALADTARADEVQALYDELVKKLNAYFTLAETQEKNELVAELNGYGNQSDYDEETWTEICLVKAEYLLYIENATSIWDVRQLVAAAKADVDSFVKIGDPSYQPSVSEEESAGCGSFVGVSAVALTTAIAVATFALRRKED